MLFFTVFISACLPEITDTISKETRPIGTIEAQKSPVISEIPTVSQNDIPATAKKQSYAWIPAIALPSLAIVGIVGSVYKFFKKEKEKIENFLGKTTPINIPVTPNRSNITNKVTKQKTTQTSKRRRVKIKHTAQNQPPKPSKIKIEFQHTPSPTPSQNISTQTLVQKKPQASVRVENQREALEKAKQEHAQLQEESKRAYEAVKQAQDKADKLIQKIKASQLNEASVRDLVAEIENLTQTKVMLTNSDLSSSNEATQNLLKTRLSMAVELWVASIVRTNLTEKDWEHLIAQKYLEILDLEEKIGITHPVQKNTIPQEPIKHTSTQPINQPTSNVKTEEIAQQKSTTEQTLLEAHSSLLQEQERMREYTDSLQTRIDKTSFPLEPSLLASIQEAEEQLTGKKTITQTQLSKLGAEQLSLKLELWYGEYFTKWQEKIDELEKQMLPK